MKPFKGPFFQELFQFECYFPHSYPYKGPRLFYYSSISRQLLKKLGEHKLVMPFGFEVNNPIFTNDWNPVFTISNIIFALEMMVTSPSDQSVQSSNY